MRLDLFSEPYSPNGNISADGVGKSLATPSLDRQRILFREAIQNSWDARLSQTGQPVPVFEARLRRLDDEQLFWLREKVFQSLPGDGKMIEQLKKWARSDSWILDLSDFHTTGLAGPLRADKIIKDGLTDFVDFVRNIGSPRDKHLGGGTYGFGKSASYMASQLKTIAISTRTLHNDVEEDRFMMARLGPTFTTPVADEKVKRYTGRHWWGIRDDVADTIDPLTGPTATDAIQRFGAPVRNVGETGTTVSILGPLLGQKTPEQFMDTFIETVLWYFWPKLVGDLRYRMTFRAVLEDQEHKIPDPAEFPPLDPFVRAIESVRNGKEADGVTRISITTGRQKKHLGWLAMAKTVHVPRCALDTGDASQVPKMCSHVALMRPAELVVKYKQGNEYPIGLKEYGGVFVADESVDEEFAASEPPAHDDWVPDYLDGKAKTWVRVAKRKIREEMSRYVSPLDSTIDGDSEQESLGAISDQIGSLFARAPGERIGPTSGRSSRSRPRKQTVSGPTHIGFERYDGRDCAVFEVEFKGPWNPGSRFEASTSVLMEGGKTSSPVGVRLPEVVGWRKSGLKEMIPSGIPSELVIGNTEELRFEILSELPESNGISLTVKQIS